MSIAEAITPSGRYIEKITRSENEGILHNLAGENFAHRLERASQIGRPFFFGRIPPRTQKSLFRSPQPSART